MRLLFAGSPSIAVPSLERVAREHEVCAVLTCCDQPAGRGMAVQPSSVRRSAEALGLSVIMADTLDAGIVEKVRALKPEILVVAAFGKIFRKSFLDIFPLGGVNLHPSLLPRYRGPSPIAAAILAGDQRTGVTVQKLARRFDTGDILAQQELALTGEETTGSLSETLAEIGAEVLSGVLSKAAAGRPLAGTPQVEELATYCHPISKEDGLVRWTESAVSIERMTRAYDPWPRARTTCQGVSLILLKTRVYPGTLAGAPGVVLSSDKEHGILVGTGDGVLALQRVQLQFKKPVDWKSFLNGHPDAIGTLLGG